MKTFTHTLDIAFNVTSEHEDWADVPADELILALERRVAYIRSTPGERADAIGHVDTIENEPPVDLHD